MRITHTVVHLPVSLNTYSEIATLLKTAGYDHVFLECEQGVPPMIDMSGIALTVKKLDVEASTADLDIKDKLQRGTS